MTEYRYFDGTDLVFVHRTYVDTGIRYRYTRHPWRLVIECEDPVGAYFEAFT